MLHSSLASGPVTVVIDAFTQVTLIQNILIECICQEGKESSLIASAEESSVLIMHSKFSLTKQLSEATKGLSGRPLETFGPLQQVEICIQNSFLAEGRKRAYLSFPVSQRISPLGRRPKGFPVALWKPSALCRNAKSEFAKRRFLVAGRKQAFLFSV